MIEVFFSSKVLFLSLVTFSSYIAYFLSCRYPFVVLFPFLCAWQTMDEYLSLWSFYVQRQLLYNNLPSSSKFDQTTICSYDDVKLHDCFLYDNKPYHYL
jgi:hypothetical protein